MTEAERDAFLAVPRLGMLSTLRADGAPVAVPVWFEWSNGLIRVFAGASSGKIERIQRDRRVSLLVTNVVGEPEAWVAFDGRMEVRKEGALDLSERLAQRYWDMSDAGHKKTLEEWRAGAASLRLLELKPSAIRSSKG